ncbi:hypothetical protein [Sphingomonas sp. OTU376]|uniref:hypothetical protein n=1 Tax=Sphingomonas sp. OTU376 TaxID=3043863 RepID=UPI00313C5B04
MTGSSKVAAAAARIETALTRSARSRVIPDYSGFKIFMAPHLEREREKRTAEVHSDVAPFAAASMMLLTRYHQRLVNGQPSPMDIRRYKLLRSLYADGGRREQVANALLYGTLPADPTLDAGEGPAAVLRMRLIAAIQNGDFEDANFLLGRLDEADHDIGERAYLQALASYAAGKLERTIKLLETVPEDAIDRPRAAWLAAKASALLGDAPSLERLLAEITDRLTPCAWLHLFELLDLAEEKDEVEVLMQRLPAVLNVTTSDPAYDEWALLHAQMIGRLNARDHEIMEASAANGTFPSDEEIAADPVYRRYSAAMFVEHKLRGLEQAGDIAGWLAPVVAKGSVAAFRSAVEMLSAAGDHAGVVALAKRFPSKAGLPWQRELDIVAIVFGAATVAGDRMARRLQRLLTSDVLEPVEAGAQRLAVAARLTPMGRISFLASATELDRVRSAGDIWRDCGLIALGLVRALEVELNARLVRPLASSLDIPALTSQLPQVDDARAIRAALRNLAGLASSGHGLMFGEMRGLIERLTEPAGTNLQVESVRARIRAGFDALLSEAGRRTSSLDQIAGMIGSAAVGRFRNPPAHGQFLRLDEAAAALRHVEDALDKLSQWIPRAQ